MFKDITIGRYVHGTTVLHKMAPWVKIVLTIIYALTLFWLSSPLSYAVYILFTLLIILISKISVRLMLKGIKPLIWLLIFASVFNIFLVPGKEMFTFLSFTATYEGVIEAVKLAVRLILLIVTTSLLTLTTTPIALTDGIEKILRPLDKIHIPSHEIAMMMSIALRFIPILLEETDKIMKAQIARGADFESGNLMKKAKSLVPLLVPLFISAFRRANDLATAMEARCYRGGEHRTKMKPLIYQKRDRLAYGALWGYLVICIVVGRVL